MAMLASVGFQSVVVAALWARAGSLSRHCSHKRWGPGAGPVLLMAWCTGVTIALLRQMGGIVWRPPVAMALETQVAFLTRCGASLLVGLCRI